MKTSERETSDRCAASIRREETQVRLLSAPRAILPFGTLWAIEEGYASQALDALATVDLAMLMRTDIEARASRSRSSEHERPTRSVDTSRREERPTRSVDTSRREEDRPYEVQDGIAILMIEGPLTKQRTCASWLFGGTSTVEARRALRLAARDPEVKRICLQIDSPGGQVAGTFDLADEVGKIAQVMPVCAYISDLCASAAYAIASQATHIYANRTALVGSIGVYMALQDVSQIYRAAGVKVHVVRAGAYKGAGLRGTEVTEGQLQEFQRNIDATNAQFLATVGMGRKRDAETVAALADGRVHVGQAAQDLGLIDGICSLEDCLSALGQRVVFLEKRTAVKGSLETNVCHDW